MGHVIASRRGSVRTAIRGIKHNLHVSVTVTVSYLFLFLSLFFGDHDLIKENMAKAEECAYPLFYCPCASTDI